MFVYDLSHFLNGPRNSLYFSSFRPTRTLVPSLTPLHNAMGGLYISLRSTFTTKLQGGFRPRFDHYIYIKCMRDVHARGGYRVHAHSPLDVDRDGRSPIHVLADEYKEGKSMVDSDGDGEDGEDSYF